MCPAWLRAVLLRGLEVSREAAVPQHDGPPGSLVQRFGAWPVSAVETDQVPAMGASETEMRTSVRSVLRPRRARAGLLFVAGGVAASALVWLVLARPPPSVGPVAPHLDAPAASTSACPHGAPNCSRAHTGGADRPSLKLAPPRPPIAQRNGWHRIHERTKATRARPARPDRRRRAQTVLSGVVLSSETRETRGGALKRARETRSSRPCRAGERRPSLRLKRRESGRSP